MKVLGISAFYHDSAAALVEDGKVIAASQEERFTRIKHDASYPARSIESCLSIAGVSANEIDAFVFYEKPFLKFERLLETYFAFAPRGFATFRHSMPLWFHQKLFQKSHLLKRLKQSAPEVDWKKKLLFSEHHTSHAASAFYPSPFREAAVLTMDGVGEWTTTSLAVGRGNHLEVLKEIHFPHSIGLLYSAITYALGFKVNSGEYKVMGLAPYGEPRYAKLLREHVIDIKADGTFRLNLDYFDFCTELRMTSARFEKLLGEPRRQPEQALTQFHRDLAASVQAVVEEVVLRLAASAVRETGLSQLCLAGGVALNCVANGKILRSGTVEKLWVQPAAGDAGGALGAALAATYGQLGAVRENPTTDGMAGGYLGPHFSSGEVQSALSQLGARFSTSPDEATLIDTVAKALAEEKAVGWFQQRMEFGPRALGARSILADPRSPQMQSMLNQKIKYRESFRPFAPIVLKDDLKEWFDLDSESPYMLLVAPVSEEKRLPEGGAESVEGFDRLGLRRSEIPAVTHVDGSARIQTVDGSTHPRLHRLLQAFKKKTGCPVLVNTSFNVRGEPMVCSPEDAFRCFMGTELDLLVIEDCIVWKDEQAHLPRPAHVSQFELD